MNAVIDSIKFSLTRSVFHILRPHATVTGNTCLSSKFTRRQLLLRYPHGATWEFVFRKFPAFSARSVVESRRKILLTAVGIHFLCQRDPAVLSVYGSDVRFLIVKRRGTDVAEKTRGSNQDWTLSSAVQQRKEDDLVCCDVRNLQIVLYRGWSIKCAVVSSDLKVYSFWSFITVQNNFKVGAGCAVRTHLLSYFK